MSTYGKHTTYLDGENFNAAEANKHIDFRTYATYALAAAAVAGWGNAEIGLHILVSGQGKWYYWNGSSLTGFPSVGGSGAPTDATYVTIGDEAGLSAETVHSAITGANLHICQLHDSTHENGGTDEISVTGLSGLLADEQNAGKIKTKSVDAPVAGDDLKFLQYNDGASKFQLATVAGGGDMMAAVYDTDSDNVVESADDADTVDGSHASAFALATHNNTHATGSTDAFAVTDLLDGIARTTVSLNGAPVGSRRILDLKDTVGQLTWTVTDVPGTETVTIKPTVTSSVETHDILSTQHSDTTIATEVDGSILQYVTNKWVQKKSKRGTATLANNGTITHGLGLTPSTVFLTANAVQPYALGYEVSSTTVTVHHNAAGPLILSYWVIE